MCTFYYTIETTGKKLACFQNTIYSDIDSDKI